MKKFIVKKELKDFVRPVSVDFSKASQVYVRERESVFVSVCVYIIRMYVCVCVCVCTCTHTHMCVYMYMYVYVFIYIHTSIHKKIFFFLRKGEQMVCVLKSGIRRSTRTSSYASKSHRYIYRKIKQLK